jgi:hypothetical protein
MHPGAASQSEDKLYLIRNRLNGHDAKSDISNSYGGTENYGLPVFVHTFAYYVPNDMFGEHPEWFSMVDGKRVNNSQLCMTNRELLEYMTNNAVDFIKGKKDIHSDEDWGVWCKTLGKYNYQKVNKILQYYVDNFPFR